MIKKVFEVLETVSICFPFSWETEKQEKMLGQSLFALSESTITL